MSIQVCLNKEQIQWVSSEYPAAELRNILLIKGCVLTIEVKDTRTRSGRLQTLSDILACQHNSELSFDTALIISGEYVSKTINGVVYTFPFYQTVDEFVLSVTDRTYQLAYLDNLLRENKLMEYVESKVRQKLDKHYSLLVDPKVTISDYEIECIKTLNRSVKETIRRYEYLFESKLTLSFNAALSIN